MVEQTFPLGGTTGFHLLEQGDELFYVVSGNGLATLGTSEVVKAPRDVIFISAELDRPISQEEMLDIDNRTDGVAQ